MAEPAAARINPNTPRQPYVYRAASRKGGKSKDRNLWAGLGRDLRGLAANKTIVNDSIVNDSIVNDSILDRRWGSTGELLAVEYTVDWNPHMVTIQVVLDSKLLRAADRAARRTKLNRSALIRDAMREHLRRLEIQELEKRDRRGYEIGPRAGHELSVWEAEATWPVE